MVEQDRRQFQRLKLARPILANLDGQTALVLDVGIGGALIEHYGPSAPGERRTLRFRWDSHDVEAVTEVVRSTQARQVAGDGSSVLTHSATRFVEVSDDSAYWLQQMMATFVGRVLAAQRANMLGQFGKDFIDGTASLSDLGGARRARTRGFLRFRLMGSSWWKTPTESAAQPVDGFTVAASEDEEELETLCRAYESADEEGRRLIRLVAELSAAGTNRNP
jgi:hypothetical protein